MTGKLWLLAGVAAIIGCGQARAGVDDILIGLDSKIAYGPEGQHNVQPGQDAVLVMDVTNPAQPRIRASLPLTNSLLGPPTNLQITPDGRLGLLADSGAHQADGTGWKVVPDNKLFVIDLAANPPKLLDTVTVGQQPSGLAIARNGKLALIANRAGKSVSVLSIDGATVKQIAEVSTGQEVAAVAITPDGKRAFAAMNLVNKIAVLEINGQTVTYDKAMDVPAAINPYNIAITPDGKYTVASCTGAGQNNADAIVTIEATGPHPHVVQLSTTGTGPEGFAIAPNGRYAVTPLLLGSSQKPPDWFYTKTGQAVLMTIGADGELKPVSRQKLGGVPEGIAFSRNSEWVYIANYIDQNLQVFRIQGNTLQPHGTPIKLPGQPASMRGVEP